MFRDKSANCFIKLVIAICFLGQILIAAACDSKTVNSNTASVPQNTVKPDERTSLLDGRVSFIPPTGFKTVTKEQLKAKLAENSKLLLIMDNVNQTGYITVNYDNDLKLNSNQLADIKTFTEGTYRAATMEWVKSEIVEMNGRQWFHFEWESEVSELSTLVAPEPESNKTPEIQKEYPSHYDEYSTIFNSKLLSFAFVSQVKEFTELNNEYMKSIQSIRIKE